MACGAKDQNRAPRRVNILWDPSKGPIRPEVFFGGVLGRDERVPVRSGRSHIQEAGDRIARNVGGAKPAETALMTPQPKGRSSRTSWATPTRRLCTSALGHLQRGENPPRVKNAAIRFTTASGATFPITTTSTRTVDARGAEPVAYAGDTGNTYDMKAEVTSRSCSKATSRATSTPNAHERA